MFSTTDHLCRFLAVASPGTCLLVGSSFSLPGGHPGKHCVTFPPPCAAAGRHTPEATRLLLPRLRPQDAMLTAYRQTLVTQASEFTYPLCLCTTSSCFLALNFRIVQTKCHFHQHPSLMVALLNDAQKYIPIKSHHISKNAGTICGIGYPDKLHLINII